MSGDRLDTVEDGIADTLVCYLVLQHLPERQVVLRYLEEFGRVLTRRWAARSCSCPCCGTVFARALWRLARAVAVPVSDLFRRGVTDSAAYRGTRLTEGELQSGSRRRRPPHGRPRREPRVAVPLRTRGLSAAGAHRVTALVLVLYGVALAAAAVAVWRRPIVALYLFIVGLALHNLVLALLYDAGLRGWEIDAVQAWKEALLAVAVARVATDAVRERRLPFRPRVVDWLALAFAAVVCLYALIPQDVLDGEAGARAVLYGLRHGLVPVVAYFLGRSLILSRVDLRRIGWTLLGAGAALAIGGLVDLYAVDVEWWRGSGAVGYFRYELGFDYHGPGGLPDNWAFNTEDGLFRRLVSSFISPLATAFALVVALLFAGIAWQDRRRRPLAAALVAVCAAALLFTLSRSSLLALAGAFVVLAVALRRWWPVVATAVVLAAGVGFAFAFTSVAPETHFFPEDLPYQEEQARKHGGLPGGGSLALNPGEPSLRSHWQSLRDGIETVFEHPQGYGLGNAGAIAVRFGVPLRAGESNYTETGVEAGLVGALLLIAWSLALLVALVRSAWAATDATFRVAAAGAAAAFAAVLALAVQTDVYGVPWLAYSLWWLCGSLVDLSDRP